VLINWCRTSPEGGRSISFEDYFREAVQRTFSNFGIASSVMVRDIEARVGRKSSKWWKDPEQVSKALRDIYGTGGASIEQALIRSLAEVTKYEGDPGDELRIASERIKDYLDHKR